MREERERKRWEVSGWQENQIFSSHNRVLSSSIPSPPLISSLLPHFSRLIPTSRMAHLPESHVSTRTRQTRHIRSHEADYIRSYIVSPCSLFFFFFSLFLPPLPLGFVLLYFLLYFFLNSKDIITFALDIWRKFWMRICICFPSFLFPCPLPPLFPPLFPLLFPALLPPLFPPPHLFSFTSMVLISPFHLFSNSISSIYVFFFLFNKNKFISFILLIYPNWE